MKIQEKRKKRKKATKKVLRDTKNAERTTKVLGHSKSPVLPLVGDGGARVSQARNAESRSSAESAQRDTEHEQRAVLRELRTSETEQIAALSAGKDIAAGEREKEIERRNGEGGGDNEEPATTGVKNVEQDEEKRTRKRPVAAREQLLNAGLYLFWQKGYAETSMIDVFKRSGVNAGSMYYYFKSKEELLLGVLDRLAEMLYPALLAPVWETVSDPIERIFGLLDVYRRGILASNFNYGCPVGRLAVEVSGDLLEVHKKIAMNFEGWSNAVQKCLEDAGTRLPKSIDKKMLSHFVLTVMEGGVMQSRSYKRIDPFDQGVAQLRDYFNRLEAQGESEAMRGGESFWDLQKKKKQGPAPR